MNEPFVGINSREGLAGLVGRHHTIVNHWHAVSPFVPAVFAFLLVILLLAPLLVVRPPGSPGSAAVREHLVAHLAGGRA